MGNGLSALDLRQIAWFHKIVKNYIMMDKKLNENSNAEYKGTGC